MITPFNNNFEIENFEIDHTFIQHGYVLFNKIPEIGTVSVDLNESNNILSTGFIIEEITIDNVQLYPDGSVGEYVLTWISQPSSSSSSSGSSNELELKILLDSELYQYFQLRYISAT